MSEVELIGVITKLEDGYAYAKTDIGDVYIPINSARNKSETLTSLKEKFVELYRYQDEVMLTVVEQSGKNACRYVAKKIKSIDRNGAGTSSDREMLSPEIHGPILAKITSTTDSYAFAHNDDEFGTVFIPGEAFDSAKVRCVKRYVVIGDQMVLTVKRQKSQNGCSWVAVSAEKHFTQEEKSPAAAAGDIVVSFGKVVEVQATHVDVWDEKNELLVTCPTLTYVGGLRGRKNVKSLVDLVAKDEHVMFRAEVSEQGLGNAHEWKQVGEGGPLLEEPRKVLTRDAHTQTCTELTNLILKSILRQNYEIREQFKEQIDLLPHTAVPDDLLLSREGRNFGGWPTDNYSTR